MRVEVAVPPHRHYVGSSSRRRLCIRGCFARRLQLDVAWLHPVQDSEVGIACYILVYSRAKLPKYRALLHRSGRMTVRWCHIVSRLAVFALGSNILAPRQDVEPVGGNNGESK
jgi:hypothetical protein